MTSECVKNDDVSDGLSYKYKHENLSAEEKKGVMNQYQLFEYMILLNIMVMNLYLIREYMKV